MEAKAISKGQNVDAVRSFNADLVKRPSVIFTPYFGLIYANILQE